MIEERNTEPVRGGGEGDSRGGGSYPYPYGYPAHPPSTPSPLKFYFDVLRRRLWLALPVVVICATVGSLRAFRAAPYYTARAKVLVERQTPRVAGIEGVSQDMSLWGDDFYRTQAELVRTRAVMEVALRDPAVSNLVPAAAGLGEVSGLAGVKRSLVALLGAVPPPPPLSWERLAAEISAEHEKNTYFVYITSTGPNPSRAASLVNAAARAFAEYHATRRREVLGDAFVFLDEEKRKQEEHLLQAQKELQEFRDKAKNVTLDGSGKDQPAIARLNDLSEKLTQVQIERMELTSSIDTVSNLTVNVGALSGGDTRRLLSLWVVREDPLLSETYRKVIEAREEEGRLGAIYGPQHPSMVAATGTTARLETQLRDVLGQKMESLAGRERLLAARETSLSGELEAQRHEALQLARETFTFSQLQNEVRRHQKLYEALVDRLREVDISTGFVRTNARIVQDATPPAAPAGPNRGRMIVIALLVGVGLGVGLALAFEHMDDTIKTPEDIKARVSLPLLGFVPRIEIQKKPGEKVSDKTRPGIVAVEEPVSSAAEAYRNIRTRLIFSLPAGEKKVIGITSCNPGEGKTTTTVNLAVAMAAAGKKVLLIDADIHRPMVHRSFLQGAEPGLTNMLADGMSFADVVRHYKFPETMAVAGALDIVMAGAESPNPAELLSSARMRRLLDERRPEYDWIFVDIPPVLFVSDASILSALCEGVLLVVRASRNNKSSLARATEQLREIKVSIIGAILNDVVLSRLGRYTSDYAYYGYSRYSRQYHKSYYSGDSDSRRPPSG